MYISGAKWLVQRCVEANIYTPFLFVGSMGIGKSDLMKQVTAEQKIGLRDIRLAQLEPGDIIGVPRSDETTNRTVWRKPEWWPAEGTRGIIHLDELNRAPVDVRQSVFQLVLDRRMHTHVLPNGWFVHASINPDNGAYQVEQLDQAMIRRFCVIKVTPDIDEWNEYWHKTHPDENDQDAILISKFVLSNKKLLCIEEQFEIEAKPTPDSYRMLYSLMKLKLPEKYQAEVVRGLIGTEASIAFIKFMDKNYVKPVSGRDVLEKYKSLTSISKLVKAQSSDATYVTISDLLTEIRMQKDLSQVQVENIAHFLMDCNEEFKASVITKMPDIYITRLSIFTPLVESIRKVMQSIKVTPDEK